MANLELDYANILKAARKDISDESSFNLAAQIAFDLWPFWFATGRLAEAREVITNLLNFEGLEPNASEIRHLILIEGAYFSLLQGDTPGAHVFLEQVEDSAIKSSSLLSALMNHMRAIEELSTGNYAQAEELIDVAITSYEAIHDFRSNPLMLDAIGFNVAILAFSGSSELARQVGEKGLRMCQEFGDVLWEAYILFVLGFEAYLRSDLVPARQFTKAAMRVSPDELLITHCIELLAWCLCKEKDYKSGALLTGTANHRWQYIGGSHSGFSIFDGERAWCQDILRDNLEPQLLTEIQHEGEKFTPGEVMGMLDILGTEIPSSPSSLDWSESTLTMREREIAEFVASGLSNREIASLLWISPRTVESHINHVLKKLQLPNRTRLASWIHKNSDSH
jgi:non-specific serine/threonine protein kinase